jgi:transposase-like protein
MKSRPNWRASGPSRRSREPSLNSPPRTAKYSHRYPEAVRSLSEEEDQTLTFYDFPQAMHRSIRTTNAIESL